MLNTLSVLSMDQGKIYKSVAGVGAEDWSDEEVLAAARQSGGSWVALLWGWAAWGQGSATSPSSHVVRR